ncbi:MAG: hypothetical protein WBZ15_05895 [Mycobacterium sp.]|uniref:hypothetical protein n=1 Tax=Mycobacterium sp. TaxID=1785 RepID=UPI003C53C29E
MADPNRLDTESMPMTEPYKPTFDTGVHPKAEPELIEPEPPARRRRWWRRRSDPTPTEAPAEVPVTDDVPAVDLYHYVKWWQFILVLLAVWIPAGGIGAGLFYWWSHDNSRHKTVVVFVVLVYVVVSAVAGLISATVPDRPLVSALAIVMISAVFAAVIGAAPVYGKFYCEHSQRHCLMNVLPY